MSWQVDSHGKGGCGTQHLLNTNKNLLLLLLRLRLLLLLVLLLLLFIAQPKLHLKHRQCFPQEQDRQGEQGLGVMGVVGVKIVHSDLQHVPARL